ncbi:gamma-interferon-responsive lysosomal thiol protein isoform X2 [Cajanus cajan]|uniref:gamma-interferon-responsive lysosomal thiol protein isoform X2 n=1 Tax=Cajanus cajan TaxID=3821 RepID=UPI00098DCCC6|nr:gamma-interferon-responsive lysosomal thiol protein isoform X2 [Cajanus cajan]
MVFPKLLITVVLMLVLFFFIHESEGASYSSTSHNGDHGGDIASIAHQKVNLSVYYDSLCLPCATFIVRDLQNIFHNKLISIINLQLVPWANAYINNTNNYSISCQKGPDECKLNSLESCVLNIWSEVDIQYEMINCMEYKAISGMVDKWMECLNELGLPKKAFLNCFYTGNGTKDYANFTYHVCKAYRGVAVPGVCNLALK